MSQPLGTDQLIAMYRLAVEEYRFQVQLNWDRARYFLGFNTAVIGVGTGLVKLGSNRAAPLEAGVFIVGLVAAVMSGCATYLQHGYYQTTRDHMTNLAAEIGLGSASIATTPGSRGERKTIPQRLGKVQNVLYVLLVVSAVIDALGVYYVATR